MKNINNTIEEVLRQRGISKAKLAAMLNDTPQNFGKKLSRNDVIPVSLVYKVSDALMHNFFLDIARDWEKSHFSIDNVINEPTQPYGKGNGFEEYIDKLIEKKLREKFRHKL